LRKNSWYKVLFLLIFLSGCASIPKETATLNALLGNQIAESKKTNLGLIDRWVLASKEKAEAILHYSWTREFIKKALRTPKIKEKMSKVVCGKDGEEDRAIIIQELTEGIWEIVEAKRKEWFDAIDAQGELLRRKVLDHYADTERMHGAITANIQSVVDSQDLDQRIREAISKPLKEVVPLDKAEENLQKVMDKIVPEKEGD